jgi:hypothetical protein
VQDRVIRHVSTNLHNLRHGHFGTLVGSAFVVDSRAHLCVVARLVCLLAIAELTYRSGLLLVAFATGTHRCHPAGRRRPDHRGGAGLAANVGQPRDGSSA